MRTEVNISVHFFFLLKFHSIVKSTVFVVVVVFCSKLYTIIYKSFIYITHVLRKEMNCCDKKGEKKGKREKGRRNKLLDSYKKNERNDVIEMRMKKEKRIELL